jgi:hypothetical protein
MFGRPLLLLQKKKLGKKNVLAFHSPRQNEINYLVYDFILRPFAGLFHQNGRFNFRYIPLT